MGGIRWEEHQIFSKLKKKKGEKENIIKMKLKHETETEDQEIIQGEDDNFYRALYESSNINIETPESNTFFENELIKPLAMRTRIFAKEK